MNGEWLDQYPVSREIVGAHLVIMEQLFGWRLAKATEEGIGEFWDYREEDADAALYGLLHWPAPPIGWVRHRLPDGSMARRDDGRGSHDRA